MVVLQPDVAAKHLACHWGRSGKQEWTGGAQNHRRSFLRFALTVQFRALRAI
jgi:hypothetical protein